MLLALQLRLKSALRVELQLVTLSFNFAYARLVIHCLPIEAPTSGLARCQALGLGLYVVRADSLIQVVDLRLKGAILGDKSILDSLMALDPSHSILIQ